MDTSKQVAQGNTVVVFVKWSGKGKATGKVSAAGGAGRGAGLKGAARWRTQSWQGKVTLVFEGHGMHTCCEVGACRVPGCLAARAPPRHQAASPPLPGTRSPTQLALGPPHPRAAQTLDQEFVHKWELGLDGKFTLLEEFMDADSWYAIAA
jgi:hypothetical protein